MYKTLFFSTFRQSLGLMRQTLENIMKLDVARLPPATQTLRKELSLQDLIQVVFFFFF